MAWTSQELLQALGDTDGVVTIAQLAELTGINRTQVSKSCEVLRQRGLAERVQLGHYRLTAAGRKVLDSGIPIKSGPKRLHTGQRRSHQGTFRDRVWTALRTLEKASLPEIVEMAAIGGERDPLCNARRYITYLINGGYLVRLARRKPGTAPTSNGYNRYLLLNNTGPKAPVYKPRQGVVHDPNTNQSY